jgi:hypothetical protein
MWIRILRQTSISGLPARVGDLVEVTPSDGRLLTGSGKAEAAPDPIPDLLPETAPRARKPRTQRNHGRP